MRHLFERAVSIYRNNGPIDLYRAIRRFIIYGSFRDELLNIMPATEQLIRLYVRLGRKIQSTKFTDTDPLKILWVDPDKITYNVDSSEIPLRFGKVYSGDWDRTDLEFTDRTVYISLSAHFINGVSWDNTEYYHSKKRKLEQGKSTRGCTTIEDLPTYFGRIDSLYNTINEKGYKTQRQLASESPEATKRQNLDSPTPGTNEIGVCIGRDGELIRGYRGEHRLAIAKILGIERVPVQVLVRHSEWQRIRDHLRSNGQSSVLTSITDWNSNCKLHPDLLDLQCREHQEY